jgi:hypothetical protein
VRSANGKNQLVNSVNEAAIIEKPRTLLAN